MNLIGLKTRNYYLKSKKFSFTISPFHRLLAITYLSKVIKSNPGTFYIVYPIFSLNSSYGPAQWYPQMMGLLRKTRKFENSVHEGRSAFE